jgi:hypothetical protein
VPANRFKTKGVVEVEHIERLNAKVAPVRQAYDAYRRLVKAVLLV